MMRLAGIVCMVEHSCHGLRRGERSDLATDALDVSPVKADLESCPSIAGKYESSAGYVNDYVAANVTFEQNGCEVVLKDGRGVPMSSWIMKQNTKQTEYRLVAFGNSTFQRSCSIYGTWPASRVLCGSASDYSQCRDISGEYTWGDKTVTLTQDHCSGLMTPADGSPSARFNMTHLARVRGDTRDDVTFTYGESDRRCLESDGGFERCERDGGFFQGVIGLPQTMDGQVLPPRLSIKTSGLDRPPAVRPVFNIRFGPTPFDKTNYWPKGNLVPLGATPRQLCNNREPATLGGDCVCPERQVCSQKGKGLDGRPWGCPSKGGDSPPYLWPRRYRYDCGEECNVQGRDCSEECKCVQPTCSSSSRCSVGYFTGSTKNRFSLPLKGFTKEDVACSSGRSRKEECVGQDKDPSEGYKMCFYCIYVPPATTTLMPPAYYR